MYVDSVYIKIQNKTPNILTVEDTIDSILTTNKSICRFGDGEFMLMNGRNIKFQNYNKKLSEELRKIITKDESNLIIALPDTFLFNEKYTDKTNEYWKREIAKYRIGLYGFLNMKKKYGNAFISRPYMNWRDKKEAYKRFEKLFSIWQNRALLIVEGEKTRMGVGNDLFKSSKSIRRILIPAENAYEKYEDILDEILRNVDDELVLISAGPTAKLLVYDLYKHKVQAIDTGHVDIEYEWFLQSVENKVAIAGKYTAEVNSGEEVNFALSKEYQKQIISKVV